MHTQDIILIFTHQNSKGITYKVLFHLENYRGVILSSREYICTKFICHYNIDKNLHHTGKKELMPSPCVVNGCVHIFYRYY